MKKIMIVISAVLIAVAAVQTARAQQSDDIITDAEITAIKTHCSDIQVTLNRLKQADKLLRLDRGQVHRVIRDKLMTPLNQRIASNQLNGSELVATTAAYNNEYQKFFAAYTEYDTALSLAISTDCVKQPTTFYDRVADAREKRFTLRQASRELVILAGQYKSQYENFKRTQTERN